MCLGEGVLLVTQRTPGGGKSMTLVFSCHVSIAGWTTISYRMTETIRSVEVD
jgi:hypothetical protein